MTSSPRVRAVAPGVRLWLLCTALLAVGAVLLAAVPRAAIDWRPALALDEPWRAWSAAFAHLSPRHLGANLLGCAVVAAFAAAARVPPRASLAWLAAWPLTHFALALEPRLESYAGLSGLLHAGVAIAAWHLLVHDHGRRRAIGAAVLAGLVIKLLLERPWLAPAQPVAGWDFAVAPWGHVSGTASGLLCAAVCDHLPRGRQ